MSLKYQPINPRIQAVIDVLKKEHPGSAIETLSYDFDSYDVILEHGSGVFVIGIKLSRATMQTVLSSCYTARRSHSAMAARPCT
jgi:hypothetical protein